MVCADCNLPPIYAISDEGQLNMEDTIENQGLTIFFRKALADVVNVNAAKLDDVDSTLQDPPKIFVERRVRPILAEQVRKWGQDYPYNIYCPVKSGRSTRVGAAAVAIGSIMSYYKWPESYNGHSYNWDSMCAGDADNDVARLFVDLGLPDNLNMIYRIDTSDAFKKRYAQTFINFNYNSCGSPKKDVEALYRIFKLTEGAYHVNYKPRPLLMRGEILFPGSSDYAWVVDGGIAYMLSWFWYWSLLYRI